MKPKAFKSNTPAPVVIERAKRDAMRMGAADGMIHGGAMMMAAMDASESPDAVAVFQYPHTTNRKVLAMCMVLTDQHPPMFHLIFDEAVRLANKAPDFYEIPDVTPSGVIDAEFEDDNGPGLMMLDDGTRLVDKDGDPWIITRHGARCLPDDLDRFVDWAFEDLPQAEKMHGPFRIVPPTENTPDA